MTKVHTPAWSFTLLALLLPPAVWAGGTQTLDPVEVKGSGTLVGAADSASEGTVTQQQIATRA